MRRILPWLAVLSGCSCSPRGAGSGDTAPHPATDSSHETGLIDTGDTAAATPRWIGVAAGFAASCGIRPDGSAECWGSERYLGPNGSRPGPFVQVVIGSVYACGLLANGSIECWGCEDGWTGTVCQTRAGPYQAVEAGSSAACAQRLDGTWECWGEASNWEPFPEPPPVAFPELEMSHHLICGLAQPGDEPTCWGKYLYDEEAPPDGLSLTKLAGGFLHVCALDVDGYPLCWGLANDLTPYPTPPHEPFVDIDASELLTCALRADGTADCWNPEVSQPIDFEPPLGVVFSEISVGNTHACGLTPDGEIVCWGHDRVGETVVPE